MAKNVREQVRVPAVEAVMTRDPITIGPEGTVEQAAGAMIENGIRHLPVVDDEGQVLGLLSEGDIRERIGSDPPDWFNAAADLLEDVVANAMTSDPPVARVGMPLTEAIEILEGERVGALPVIDADDHLVGMLSYVDVLEWMRTALAGRRPTETEPAPTRH